MKIITSINEMQELSRDLEDIGLVPTMGFLHEGHLSLVRKAKEECETVIVSIFVNPAQFGPDEDFANYPKDFERDNELCDKEGVDIIFAPTAEEMYNASLTTVNVDKITKKLCGLSRPVHFSGVATVVTKLFNIVQPDRAYFGGKDYQQVLVIKQIVKDLNIPTKIIACHIVREEDGLAMSSRNKNLTEDERKQATVMYESLKLAEEIIKNGEDDVDKVKFLIRNKIKEKPAAEIDYVDILKAETLDDVEKIEGNVVIALAVKFGKARLIDNLVLK